MKKLFSIFLSALLCANILVASPLLETQDNTINPPAVEQEREEECEPNDEDPGCIEDSPR